jgi:EmrB/QacA subfamily drug resistance transporter
LPGETPHAAAPKEASSRDHKWVLPATILGSSLGFIDGSVVNVALPAIQASLQSSLATMQWVANGYMLMLAGLILLGGSAGDHFGRKRMFIVGLVGFAMASAACGLAPSAAWLIAARHVQGIAAALLTPASLAIISAAYHGKERGRAIGTWAAAGALTTALGPPLGGWLVDTVGWRSIFFINVPVAILAWLLALKLPADSKRDSAEPLDLRGAVLAVMALGLLSYGLIALGEGNRAPGAIAIVAAIPAGGLFILAELRSAHPMVPLSLFRNRNFAAVNGLTVLLYAALSGVVFLLPFMLIQAHGFSATAAGAAFLPFSVIMGGGSRWAGGLVEKIGPRLPLIVGPALTAAGFAILGLSSGNPSYWTGFLPGLVVVGIGMTLAIPPLTTTVFDSAPDDISGTASGINNAAARGGGMVAVAALGLAFGGSDLSAVDPASLADAYRWVMFAATALAGLSAAIAAWAIGSGKGNETAQTAATAKAAH